MTTYARIQGNTAVEVFVPHEGFSLAECFHPEIAALFVQVPDGTLTGATTDDGGKTWTNHATQAQGDTAQTVVVYDLLTPMQFYVAFTPAERMKLKALAITGIPATADTPEYPVDPVIAEFWATYQMAVSAGAHIDPNLPSTQEALEYLASPSAPTPQVITADRIPQILAGIAQ
jgi:hypothetical protein